MSLILDSGVIIAFTAKETDKDLGSIEKILDLTNNGKLRTSISSITVSEIYAHFYKKKDPRTAVEAFTYLDEINVENIDVNKEIAKNAGVLKSKYQISFADAIILSTCISLKGFLITYDKEFSSVKDVQILKPEEFVEMLNSPIKMKCVCGGSMKEIHKEIMGKKTKVDVCDNCGKELMDLDEAVRAQKKIRKDRK